MAVTVNEYLSDRLPLMAVEVRTYVAGKKLMYKTI